MTSFVLLSALMVAIAVAYLLWPLIKSKRGTQSGSGAHREQLLRDAFAAGLLSQEEFDHKRAVLEQDNTEQGALSLNDAASSGAASRTNTLVLGGVAILLPICAFLLYKTIGQPSQLNSTSALMASTTTSATAASGSAKDMSSAIASLKQKLEANPKDVDGWLLLGRAYESVGRNTDAANALKEAYRLAPQRPEIEIAYAESMALTSPNRLISGEPLKMLRHAMQSDPNNQDGLWLIGMSDYQNGHYADAISSWEKIKAQLPTNSDVLESVTKMIADAKVRLSGKLPASEAGTIDTAASTDASTPAPKAASSQGPKLMVEVSLADNYRDRVAPGDTLFVYAKAVSGPPMPIAIQKLQASALPAKIELTDGMGMMPSMNLSQFDQVIVTARISKSGNAIPQSGDLQAVSAPIAVSTQAPLKLAIHQAIP